MSLLSRLSSVRQSWTQYLLSTALSVGALLSAPDAQAQEAPSRDGAALDTFYVTMKQNLFIGRDTIVSPTAVWPHAKINRMTPRQQIEFFRAMDDRARQDGYTLSAATASDTLNIKSTYNTADRALQSVANPAQQNAYLIETFNFDDRAWPEFTMAKHVIQQQPKKPVNPQTPSLTYQSLLNATRDKQGKPNADKAALVLQIMCGMTNHPDNLVSTPDLRTADYDTLQQIAKTLMTRAKTNTHAQWSRAAFDQSVHVHHDLIKTQTRAYTQNHAADLDRIMPALKTVPDHVKRVIPNLTIKQRTHDPADQLREAVAGFYELVGYDAYDLLNAMAAGRGQMLLQDFYKTLPRYNKTPGRADKRVAAVMGKGLLKPYARAGYGDDFAPDALLKTYTVADACFDGTQRPVIPPKRVLASQMIVRPLPSIVQPDTLTIVETDSVLTDIVRHAPHNTITLGSVNNDRWEAFHPDYNQTINGQPQGAVIRRDGAHVTLGLMQPVGKGQWKNRGTDTQPDYAYRPAFMGFGVALRAEAGRMTVDPRASFLAATSTLPTEPITTPYSYIEPTALLQAGPLRLGVGMGWLRPVPQNGYQDYLREQSRMTYTADLNLVNMAMGKTKRTMLKVAVSAGVNDVNRTLLNRNYNPNNRSGLVEPRAQSRWGVQATVGLKNNWGLTASYVRVNTNPVNFNVTERDALRNALTGGNPYNTVNISLHRTLGGKVKTQQTNSGSKTHDTTTRTQRVQHIDRAVFSTWRRMGRSITAPLKPDHTVVDSTQTGAIRNLNRSYGL